MLNTSKHVFGLLSKLSSSIVFFFFFTFQKIFWLWKAELWVAVSAHPCCSYCPPPAGGSRVGHPDWRNASCAGSWLSGGWPRPCPVGWWWRQGEAAFWPAQKTQSFLYHDESEPHFGTSPSAGFVNWEDEKGGQMLGKDVISLLYLWVEGWDHTVIFFFRHVSSFIWISLLKRIN